MTVPPAKIWCSFVVGLVTRTIYFPQFRLLFVYFTSNHMNQSPYTNVICEEEGLVVC